MEFVEHNDLKLSYIVYGDGKETIICFHGHGKSAEDYAFLENTNRKIISINLFFHGKSTVGTDRLEKNLITLNELTILIDKIILLENVNKFHLIAYSQGGRFALCIIPRYAKQLKSIHLMAIDGMDNNNFYSWTQRRWLTRKLFKRWTKKTEELNAIAAFLARIKIIDKKLYDFLTYYTSEKDRITLGYMAWVAFRGLKPNYKKIKNALQKEKTPFQFIIGKNDKVITLKTAKKFLKRINQEKNITIVPFGHDLFKPEAKEKLIELIKIE